MPSTSHATTPRRNPKASSNGFDGCEGVPAKLAARRIETNGPQLGRAISSFERGGRADPVRTTKEDEEATVEDGDSGEDDPSRDELIDHPATKGRKEKARRE